MLKQILWNKPKVEVFIDLAGRDLTSGSIINISASEIAKLDKHFIFKIKDGDIINTYTEYHIDNEDGLKIVIDLLDFENSHYVISGNTLTYDSGDGYFMDTDKTLSIANLPADAKATGDAIKAVEDEVDDVKSDLNNGYVDIPNIIQGSTNQQGEVTVNSKRIRAESFLEVKSGEILSFKKGTNASEMLISYFNTSKTWVSDSPWYTADTEISILSDGFLVLVFRNSSNTDITPSQYDAITILKTLNGVRVEKIENDIIKLDGVVTTIGELILTDDFVDITNDLTVIGNGYYNNPITMGLTDWKNSADTKTYSYSVNKGDTVKISGYNYYACRLVYFRSATKRSEDLVYPSVVNTTQLYTYTFTAPTDGTIYVGTETAHDNDLYVGLSTTKVANPYIIDRLYGKTWLCMGDSITYNSGSYHEIIAEETGVIPTNEGKTGTGYTKDSDGNSKFVTRIQAITDVYDIFTIFGSVNDTAYAQSDALIGTKSDTLPTDTYCAYVNAAIDAVYASGNNHLGIISPIPWDANSGNPTYDFSGRKMANALKGICEYRGIPYLDLFRSSNMRPWESNFKTAYIPDGTHPNSAGYHLFANRIEAFIRTL